MLDPSQGAGYGQYANVHDAHAADLDGQGLGPETFTLARGTRALGHVSLRLTPDVVRLGLFVTPLQVGDNPFEVGLPGVHVARMGLMAHGYGLSFVSVQHKVNRPVWQVPDLRLGGETVGSRYRLNQTPVPAAGGAGADPGSYRSFGHGKSSVGYDEVRVYHQLEPQPGTRGTCSMGAIKAKGAGLNLRQADAAVDAGKVLGKDQLFSSILTPTFGHPSSHWERGLG